MRIDSIEISIVMPVYNAEKYLHETINSIKQQTFNKWELIIIDDGSTDDSSRICDEYANGDNRIKCLHVENGGVSRARNIGISKAKGKYLMFIDSDDKYNSNTLEMVVNNCQSADVLIFGYETFPEKHCYFPKARTIVEGDIQLEDMVLELLSNRLLNSIWNKVYNLEIVNVNGCEFDVDMSLGEDLLFNLQYFKTCKTFRTLDEKLYYYRVETNNSLSSKPRNDFFSIQLELKNSIEKCNFGDSVKHEALRQFNCNVIESIKQYAYVSNSLDEFKKNVSECIMSKELQNSLKKDSKKPSSCDWISYYSILMKNYSLIYYSFKLRQCISNLIHR